VNHLVSSFYLSQLVGCFKCLDFLSCELAAGLVLHAVAAHFCINFDKSISGTNLFFVFIIFYKFICANAALIQKNKLCAV